MIVKQNQSSIDIATQINGDPKSVLDICLANDFSITEELTAGTEYVLAETIHIEENVREYFETKEQVLTTSQPKEEGKILGIGTMIIGSDFDVFPDTEDENEGLIFEEEQT